MYSTRESIRNELCYEGCFRLPLVVAVLPEDRRPDSVLPTSGWFASLAGPYVCWLMVRIFVNLLMKNRDGELAVRTVQCRVDALCNCGWILRGFSDVFKCFIHQSPVVISRLLGFNITVSLEGWLA